MKCGSDRGKEEHSCQQRRGEPAHSTRGEGHFYVMALFSRWSTFAAAAASAGGALAVATSVMMGFEPVRAKSVEEYQREIYLHKDGAGKTLADKTAKLPKPVDLIGPAEKEKGAPLTEDERNFLTALSTHPYYAWKPTEEEKAKRDALRKKAFEEIAKRRAERASSVELKAAPVAPGLSDKEFRPFTLAQVTDVSHNTKLFRFKLPREYQALGLTVASCLVTKAEIDGAWGGAGRARDRAFPRVGNRGNGSLVASCVGPRGRRLARLLLPASAFACLCPVSRRVWLCVCLCVRTRRQDGDPPLHAHKRREGPGLL